MIRTNTIPHSLKFSLQVSLYVLMISAGAISSAQVLSSNYYETTCPRALSAIQAAVFREVSTDHRMGASLLRLHFHDCFVNGCDASVLLNDTSTFTGEQTAGANAGSLRGFDVVDKIKAQVESVCPGVVSCADILAVAARDSVVALGGPSWEVELGRRDSTTASLSAANADIPSPIMNLTNLISAFQKKGLTPNDLVALSGAHTTGKARCRVYRNRIYNETDIESSFATSLEENCPSSTGNGDDNLAPLDVTSPITFDNAYFTNLENNEGLIHSDQQLFTGGGSTDSQVTSYSTDTELFFRDFGSAMVKMGNVSPLTGKSGEVRTNCWKIN